MELNIKNIPIEDRTYLLYSLGLDTLEHRPYPISLKIQGMVVGTLTDFELKLDTKLIQSKFSKMYHGVG
jgi:hypothetical protein